MNSTILNTIQIVISLLIIGLVVLQARSSGLSTVFGGGAFQTTRRGSEKFLHRLTIIMVIIFCSFSLVRAFIIS